MSAPYNRGRAFRSHTGCCICGVKSSSSRFTSSKKYESYFYPCFKVDQLDRSGDICNACVLHVKRFKKERRRDCSHVVDSRVGPGSRTLSKLKKKLNEDEVISKKHRYVSKKRGVVSSDADGDVSPSPPPFKNNSASRSPCYSEDEIYYCGRPQVTHNPFCCKEFWEKRKVCCGCVYLGPDCSVGIDACLTEPCRGSDGQVDALPSGLRGYVRNSHKFIVSDDIWAPVPTANRPLEMQLLDQCVI